MGTIVLWSCLWITYLGSGCNVNIDTLKQHVIDNYDPDDVLEALDLSTEELVNAFEDKLEYYSYKFEELDEEDEDDG